MSWNVQFIAGFILSIMLAGVLAWGTKWSTFITITPRFNSLLAMGLVYVLSFVSLRRFLNFLGFLNVRYVAPALLVWVALSYGVLFVFRLEYSLYFLAYSLILMSLYFYGICYLRNKYGHVSVAYIAEGNLAERSAIPHLETIQWTELTSPAEFDATKYDVIVADLRADLSDEWVGFLAHSTLQHTPVYHSSRLIEAVSGRVKIDHLYENDLGSLLPSKGYLLLKRVLDLLLVFLSLPVTLPVMLLTGILVAMESRGGAIFRQERIGQGGVPYTMYKFRSMYVNVDNAQTREGDKRITKVGQIIRKTRLDELPQFLNVIKGEMSLIGPRSEVPSYVEGYKKEIPFYDYRHIVKPGISGWAQVMHGYTANTEETRVKLEHDFYYIKNFSFSLDLLIFFKTIVTILTGFGAR